MKPFNIEGTGERRGSRRENARFSSDPSLDPLGAAAIADSADHSHGVSREVLRTANPQWWRGLLNALGVRDETPDRTT